MELLRPQKSETVPVVLSKAEAKLIISKMTGVYQLIAQIMYGGGLRIMEVMRLRVTEIVTAIVNNMICAFHRRFMRLHQVVIGTNYHLVH